MNFQQLRYVREASRNELNLTEVSQILNTSQSGVSKQIRELEIELGVEIFVRKGKRLTGLTKVGEGAVKLIERILLETENLKRYAEQFSGEAHGRLVIATTHNQARYVLPEVIPLFAREFPGVQLELRQVTPQQAASSVLEGEADIAIATQALDQVSGLVTFPCFSWRHVVVIQRGHRLANLASPTLADVAEYPLITYSPEFSGRAQIDSAFQSQGVEPDIRLTAMDADVIKVYVERGLGVGILSEMATRELSPNLTELTGSRDLFEPSTTKVAVLRGALLQSFAYRFIELFAPHLPEPKLKEAALARLSLKPTKSQAPSTDPLPTFSERLAELQSRE
jgi:DNA-binding transcriptional LysR family regulator